MPIEKLFTFICFGLWAMGTIAIILISAFRPDIAKIGKHRRFDMSNAFDIILISTVAVWISMWCFRSMY